MKSPQVATERYATNSAKAFLEGEQNLTWITRVLEHSGLTRDWTAEILHPLATYGDPGRAQELFAWLATANW
jgi:hypothetical protein